MDRKYKRFEPQPLASVEIKPDFDAMSTFEFHKCKEHEDIIFKWSKHTQHDEPYIKVCKVCKKVLHEFGGLF